MDLDGTLTQHKSGLEPACLEVLNELSTKYKLLMVCAGGCKRVYEQMHSFPVDISGWYGMQFSTIRDGSFELIESSAEPADRTLISGRVEELRHELGFEQYAGESVEFHASGMITFPILGTEARLENKLAFDPQRIKRRECYAKVKAAFPEYTVFIGGTSSFDIAPPPFRKLYALDKCLERYGVSRSQTIYFGDDYGLGGNDEDVYNSDVPFIRVDDYRDFPGMARNMLLGD